jgi:UDP-N-acetyl-D-glucosamine dehydrogenase
MPDHVADRCAAELGVDGRDLTGQRILVVGVAYKPNVADTRHSPAVAVIRTLRARGAFVLIHDPLVPKFDVDEVTYTSVPLDRPWPAGSTGADAAIVVTPHAAVDYEAIARSAGLVLDTRNALTSVDRANIVPM